MTKEHYRDTADYITRKLMGKPEGYAVWLTFDDCKEIYKLLEEAVEKNGKEKLKSLYTRFSSQYKTE